MDNSDAHEHKENEEDEHEHEEGEDEDEDDARHTVKSARSTSDIYAGFGAERSRSRLARDDHLDFESDIRYNRVRPVQPKNSIVLGSWVKPCGTR